MDGRWIVSSVLLGIISLGGCGQSGPVKTTAGSSLKTTADPLTAAELQRFLRLIARLPDGQVPEFSPTEQRQLDTLLPARILVSEFRSRYQQLCDPIRQGQVWDASLDLSKSAEQEGWTSAELAAFIRCLSCVVMKSQLAKKHDLKEIEHQCRQEISRLVKVLDQDDQRPRSTMTEAFMQQRDTKVQRLGRMVALLEFMSQLKPIPPSNLDLIQQYVAQIRPLLPEAIDQDPFEDPFADESADVGGIVPVGYQAK